MINQDDKDGFIEAMRGITGDNLDILLQSPGGLAEATESIVALIRNRFKHVRFIIPSIAKSAATMLAMSGDELLLGPEAKLKVIDLASDPKLNEAVRALDLAIKITLAASSAFKIVENSKGDALIGHATPPINISLTPAPEAPRTVTPTEPISSLPKASVAGRKKRKKVAVGTHR